MKQKISFHCHIVLLATIFLVYHLYDFGLSAKPIVIDVYIVLLDITHILAISFAHLIGYYIFCPLLGKKKIYLYILSIPAQLIIFSAIRFVLQEVILFYLTGLHNYFSLNLIAYTLDNFYYGLPSVILSVLLYLGWQYNVHSKYTAKLEVENRQAQLQLLKSQLSPHFLFNTLNSFYSEMVDKDQGIAEDLLTLSDLLRYTLTESNKETVLLAKELEFLNNYINLQEKRFESQLYLDYEVKGNIMAQTILPAVLIHFVENVFKHGKLNDREKPALISITINTDTIEIKTSNYVQGGENYYATGIGYTNLSNRLKHTYEGRFILEKTQENDIFTTYLKMPIQP